MSEVYLYAKDADDFDCMGLCGALTPTKCEHEEIAGGMSELTLEHPIDDMGRHTLIQNGVIVKATVPVRTTPALNGTQHITTVELWTVKATANKAQH